MARALLLPLFLLAARCAAEPPYGASPALDPLHDNEQELFSRVAERVQILIPKLPKSTAHIDPPGAGNAIPPQLQVGSGAGSSVSVIGIGTLSSPLTEFPVVGNSASGGVTSGFTPPTPLLTRQESGDALQAVFHKKTPDRIFQNADADDAVSADAKTGQVAWNYMQYHSNKSSDAGAGPRQHPAFRKAWSGFSRIQRKGRKFTYFTKERKRFRKVRRLKTQLVSGHTILEFIEAILVTIGSFLMPYQEATEHQQQGTLLLFTFTTLASLAIIFYMNSDTFQLRQAPYWNPDDPNGITFRAWVTDLMQWTMMTDLAPHAQAASVASRLGGTARELVRTLDPDEYFNGGMINGVFHDPVTYIVTGLHQHYAPLEEETRLAAMTEFMAFSRR